MDAKEKDFVPVPEQPEYDEAGVDVTLVRAMLAHSPEQRLRAASEFGEWLASIGEPHEDVPVPPQHRAKFLEILNRTSPSDR